MAILTREELMGRLDCGPREMVCPLLGGSIKFKPASLQDKIDAKRISTKNGELNQAEMITCLVFSCMVEPRLSEDDILILQSKNASEVEKIFYAITGVNP